MAAAPGSGGGGVSGVEEFVGLRAGAVDPGRGGRRRRGRARGSKNKKRSWRRLGEQPLGLQLDRFLDDVRLQERAAGGLVAEKPDEALFFLDTGNEVKDSKLNRGKKKPLRIDVILESRSQVAPPKDILAYQVPNGKKLKRKQQLLERLTQRGVVSREVRRARARLRNPPPAKPKATAGPGEPPNRSFYDLWADDNPLDRPLAGQDAYFLEQTKKQRVKRPRRLQVKPSPVPAVEVTPAGGSYNPSFQAHQALLSRAHEVERQRQRVEEKLSRQLKLPTADQAPTQESRFQELCEGLLEESDSEIPELEPEAEAEICDVKPAAAAPPRKKTEQQRRREKEAKALRVQRAAERAARQRHQEVFRLRGIRRQVAQRLAELARRKELRRARRLAEADKPRRLGRLKYQDPDIDVQLSSQLSESLRTLKPEGSILRDRFKSLQKRNLIEPRERAKFKRKYKLKYVEKRAFREIQL
ncbi:ribosome biogenesis protein NOP53 [Tachyglossus aculeatus]|uniref:ribosome biogenesis protein NOP53 n=1 Tax=Tachyglossus aculeatus TaxID=9261 RepID=UPI0018F418C6|nr:ribosome biogenesis protein NOP53 [Tachyglossus aculeatus]